MLTLPAAKILNIAGLLVGLFALTLQFGLTVPASMEAGRSLAGSVVFYFSFFTILTNILAVLVHWTALAGRPAPFARPVVRAGIAVAIAVVALAYWALLSALWKPQGLFLLCDVLLHYVAPAIFVLWWLAAGTDGSLSSRHIAAWLVYPLGYGLYALLRAPIAGEVPYPFLDVSVNGWPSVFLSLAGLLLLFVVLGRLAVTADRLIGGRARETESG
ncbi:Pr6Pr family membrane protein [Nitratireductor sp. ZSWI3]|uniref:Pr6Pr family membrane protein n=1 Tax=Nitratireductor sp. ZSWI3 TaxID=2966359 RepID=UPI0021501AE8|nr:Pr6Pr family membrane protein [Nitratireductor sp. ZSWI3]MCR4266276.1 Pr6Pr family membrane protein [Nitratireductor sp. ZSWI3]